MTTTHLQTKRTAPAKQSSQGRAEVQDAAFSKLTQAFCNTLPAELKARGAELSRQSVEDMAEVLAHQVRQWVVVNPGVLKAHKSPAAPKDEWITTQEAANRCGFSRPFVATLLDSGAYKGQINRTEGGHRRVLASEFETLMAQASAKAPKTLGQARKAVDLKRLDVSAAVNGAARRQSRARAQALAKKLGLTA